MLFMNRENMTWDEFASAVRKCQKGFMGEPKELSPGKGEFHENPSACICEDFTGKEVVESNLRKFGMGKSSTWADLNATVDDESNDNETDLPDQEEVEDDTSGSQENSQLNKTQTDINASTVAEPELEHMLSD